MDRCRPRTRPRRPTPPATSCPVAGACIQSSHSIVQSAVERRVQHAEDAPCRSRGGGQQPIVGDQPVNQTIVVGADTPWVQQLEIVLLPHGFLRAAARRGATVEAKTVGGKKYQVVSFVGDNKAKVNGYISDRNLVD